MNSLSRFYLPPEAWETGRLDTGESRHCAQVLRKRPGDEVEVFDGRGRVARVRLTEVAKARCVVELEPGEMTPGPPVQLHLAVAIPKGKTMDLIVQKAVELGIRSIQPLLTDHTVVKASGSDLERKSAKWQTVALEACKQCGQNFLPKVHPVCGLDQFLARDLPADAGHVIASLAPGARDFQAVASDLKGTNEVVLLVGPEGDFSEAETAQALARGFQSVSLGNIVLRVETAVIYSLSVLKFALG